MSILQAARGVVRQSAAVAAFDDVAQHCLLPSGRHRNTLYCDVDSGEVAGADRRARRPRARRTRPRSPVAASQPPAPILAAPPASSGARAAGARWPSWCGRSAASGSPPQAGSARGRMDRRSRAGAWGRHTPGHRQPGTVRSCLHRAAGGVGRGRAAEGGPSARADAAARRRAGGPRSLIGRPSRVQGRHKHLHGPAPGPLLGVRGRPAVGGRVAGLRSGLVKILLAFPLDPRASAPARHAFGRWRQRTRLHPPPGAHQPRSVAREAPP